MKSVNEYCKVLGIDPSATTDQLKQTYRDLVNVWHPDRFSHDPRLQKKAEEKLKEINEAYDQLQSYFSNPKNRASKTSERPQSETRGERPKADETPPKPPPESPSPSTRQEIVSWVRKWWLAAVFVLLFAWGAISDRLDRPATIPESKPPQEQREYILPDSSQQRPLPEKKRKDVTDKRLPVPATTPKQSFQVTTRPDKEVTRSRSDVINKIKETHAGAEKLLAIHEVERQRLLGEYDRRRELYYQGLIKRNEVLQAQQALAEAMLRIDEDRRWLAEADLALQEYLKENPN